MQDRVWLVHGVRFNDAEVTDLGRHGLGVCHCPPSNIVLASGRCRTLERHASVRDQIERIQPSAMPNHARRRGDLVDGHLVIANAAGYG
jgi:hypothetical protein